MQEPSTDDRHHNWSWFFGATAGVIGFGMFVYSSFISQITQSVTDLIERLEEVESKTANVRDLNGVKVKTPDLLDVIASVEDNFAPITVSIVTDSDDPYGLQMAEGGNVSEALMQCIDDTHCLERPNAMAWLSILEISNYQTSSISLSFPKETVAEALKGKLDQADDRSILRECIALERLCEGQSDAELFENAKRVLRVADERFTRTIERMMESADLDSPIAQNELGHAYMNGELGLPRNYNLAEGYLVNAVAKRDPYAMFGLAKMLKDERASETVAENYYIDDLLLRAFEQGYIDVAPIIVHRHDSNGPNIDEAVRIARDDPMARSTLREWDEEPPT